QEKVGMKTRIERLSELAANTASLARRNFSSAQEAAGKASAVALAAGKSARQAIGDAIDHEDTKTALTKVKELATTATSEAKKLSDRVVLKVKAADENHKEVAEKVETVSMGLGITSGVIAAGAALAAPTGLGALGVAVGITSAPLIVTVAPVIMVAATVTGVVSGGAYFYSKWKSRKVKDDSSNK
ncbi:MAG: hypothetical protein ACKVP9_08735, partial [Burkholderiales bacterium]